MNSSFYSQFSYFSLIWMFYDGVINNKNEKKYGVGSTFSQSLEHVEVLLNGDVWEGKK